MYWYGVAVEYLSKLDVTNFARLYQHVYMLTSVCHLSCACRFLVCVHLYLFLSLCLHIVYARICLHTFVLHQGEKVDPSDIFKASGLCKASLNTTSQSYLMRFNTIDDNVSSENLDPACVDSTVAGPPLLTSTISKPRYQSIISATVNNARTAHDLSSSPITPG